MTPGVVLPPLAAPVDLLWHRLLDLAERRDIGIDAYAVLIANS